jgi:antitoxin PrlF
MLTSRLTSKAQTTIPQPIRRALHLKPGDRLEYVVRGDEVLLRKARGSDANDDPFATFDEWDSPADREAYADL